MITDAVFNFASAQSMAGGGGALVSATNAVDLQAIRDIGVGTPMNVIVRIDSTFVQSVGAAIGAVFVLVLFSGGSTQIVGSTGFIVFTDLVAGRHLTIGMQEVVKVAANLSQPAMYSSLALAMLPIGGVFDSGTITAYGALTTSVAPHVYPASLNNAT